MSDTRQRFEYRLYLGRFHIDVRRSPRIWGFRWGISRIKEWA